MVEESAPSSVSNSGMLSPSPSSSSSSIDRPNLINLINSERDSIRERESER